MRLMLLCFAVFLLLTACANGPSQTKIQLAGDPFTGFFAHPKVGELELSREGQTDNYHGTLTYEGDQFPVQGQRQGDHVRGTVMNTDGQTHPLDIEYSDKGLYVSVDGTKARDTMVSYSSRLAYEQWQAKQGAPEPPARNPDTSNPGR